MYFINVVRTKAGMTSAAESITESLRRTRQLMVQVTDDYTFNIYFTYVIGKRGL